MIGILFSLFPLIGWGASDYVSSVLSKKYHPALINLAFFVITSLPVLILCTILGLPEFSVSIIIGFAVVELLLTFGFMTMVKAFSTGATGVVAPIANAYAVITLILAVVFLGASITVNQVIIVLIIVFGIGLLSYTKDSVSVKKRHRGEILAIISMVLFGFGFAGFDIIATQEWYQNLLLFQIVGSVMAIIIYIIQVKKERVAHLISICTNKIALTGALLASTGTVGLFIAINNTANIAIPATIAAASPLVTSLLAASFEKEKLHLHQYVGMLFVIGGIVALSAAS